jgi:hypothetical protein
LEADYQRPGVPGATLNAVADSDVTAGDEEYEEEGDYEYASYKHGAESEKQGEAHAEAAVLYQPLGGGEEGGSEQASVFGGGWFRMVSEQQGGSRCTQYGGHWKGRRCVGVRSGGGGNSGDTCRTVAGVTVPLAAASGPPGWTLWVIGFGACELN